MRYAIIADVHANLEALRGALRSVDEAGVDAIYCCGDVVGYYTNPNECIDLLVAHGVTCVAGNHDLAAAGRKDLDCWYVAERALEWTKPRLTAQSRAFLWDLPLTLAVGDHLVLTHGAFHDVPDPESTYLRSLADVTASLQAVRSHPSGASIGFFGHTHQAAAYRYDGTATTVLSANASIVLDPGHTYLVNPGHVGQPREKGVAPSWVLYDAGRRELEFVQFPLEIKAARRGARREGLLPDPRVVAFSKRVIRKVRRTLASGTS